MGVYFNKGAVKSKKEVQEQIDKMNSILLASSRMLIAALRSLSILFPHAQ